MIFDEQERNSTSYKLPSNELSKLPQNYIFCGNLEHVFGATTWLVQMSNSIWIVIGWLYREQDYFSFNVKIVELVK